LLLTGIQNDDAKMNTSTFYGLNTNNSRRISRLDHPSPQVPSRDPPAKLHLDLAEYSEAEISMTDGKIFENQHWEKVGSHSSSRFIVDGLEVQRKRASFCSKKESVYTNAEKSVLQSPRARGKSNDGTLGVPKLDIPKGRAGIMTLNSQQLRDKVDHGLATGKKFFRSKTLHFDIEDLDS
jgi:hypothetical protein